MPLPPRFSSTMRAAAAIAAAVRAKPACSSGASSHSCISCTPPLPRRTGTDTLRPVWPYSPSSTTEQGKTSPVSCSTARVSAASPSALVQPAVRPDCSSS